MNNQQMPTYDIKKYDGYWKVTYKVEIALYNSLLDLVKKNFENKEQFKDTDLEKEVISRIVDQSQQPLKSKIDQDKLFLFRNEFVSSKFSDNFMEFEILMLFLNQPNLEIVKNYPDKYQFQFIEDYKIDKSLYTRSTLLVGQNLEPIKSEIPKIVDKIGRSLKVRLHFKSKKNDKTSTQEVANFIVGLGIVGFDELAALKGKKVNDKIIFPYRKIHHGWDTKNNYFLDDLFIELEILEIRNQYWRSTVNELWVEKDVKDRFVLKDNLEIFIANMSRWELQVFKNFKWSFEFVEWLVDSDIFTISNELVQILNKKYRDLFDRMQQNESLREQLKPELKDIKDFDQFAKKAMQSEINPHKISALVDNVLTSDAEAKKLFAHVAQNVQTYFLYHREIQQHEQIMNTTFMNYLTIMRVAQLQNPKVVDLIKEEMTTFKLNDVFESVK